MTFQDRIEEEIAQLRESKSTAVSSFVASLENLSANERLQASRNVALAMWDLFFVISQHIPVLNVSLANGEEIIVEGECTDEQWNRAMNQLTERTRKNARVIGDDAFRALLMLTLRCR